MSVFQNTILLSFLLLLLGCIKSRPPLIKATETLKPNVVSIEVEFADGTVAENGFGFITGEKDGQLYIVTAGHLVHGREGEAKQAQSISLRFYSRLKDYPASEETWFESDDLSLLSLRTKKYASLVKIQIGSVLAKEKFFG
jgi:formylglycine-generating enzyme